MNLFSSGVLMRDRARALWVLHAVAGDNAAIDALKHADPQIREQAVRILGRDDRENGHVEYMLKPDAKRPPAASKHLAALLHADGDGPRRGRPPRVDPWPCGTCSTDQAGEDADQASLETRTWDGRDRWYLESLGLALENRESEFLAGLFDGTLYGEIDLDEAGQAGKVALPPYFPVDRNEAFLAVGTPELPASALSKTLGLAWRLHRAEVLPELEPGLAQAVQPELQQAADDVLSQMRDPETAVVLAEVAARADDPARQRQILATLADKLDGPWRDARNRPEIVTVTEDALKDPELRLEAVDVAAATGDPRYAPAILALARDAKASAELRAAAIEAAARVDRSKARELVDALIDDAKGKKSSSAVAEAAVRSLTRLGNDPRAKLLDLIGGDNTWPLGLRREALRTFANYQNGGRRLLDLVRNKKVADDLKTEAASLLEPRTPTATSATRPRRCSPSPRRGAVDRCRRSSTWSARRDTPRRGATSSSAPPPTPAAAATASRGAGTGWDPTSRRSAPSTAATSCSARSSIRARPSGTASAP